MTKYILVVICLIAHLSVNGQEMVTDRPDQTESAQIVPQYHLQWEAGTLLELGGGQKDITLLTNLFRYGVSDKLELRLVTELIDHKATPRTASVTGISDIQLGLKYKLLTGNVDIAYMGHLILPSGTDEITSNSIGTINRLNFDFDLAENFGSGINIGYELYDTGLNGNFIYTWAVGASLTEKIGFYTELFGEWVEFEEWSHNVDYGFTYLIKNNLQLDFSIGTGITERYNYYSFGFSWRMPY